MTDLVARLRIEAEARAATGEVRAFGASVAQAGTQARGSKAGFDQAAAGAANFERQARGGQAAATAIGAALGAIGLRQFIGDINEAAFANQGFNTGLSAVAGGAAGAKSETVFLRLEAERLGLVVREQTAGFMGLAGATRGTSLEGQTTRDIWLGLVEAGTALNRSSEQQGRALEAVSQIASKGVVSMEELRGQLSEAIPGAMQIAARAMGVTTAELNKMVGDGKVLAEDFLPKFAAQLREELGPALNNSLTTPLGLARREMAETKNGIFDLQTAAGEGFLSGATAGIAAFNAEISNADTVTAAREIGSALGEGAALAAQGAALLVDNVDAVVFAVQALTGIAVVRWLTGLSVEARKAAAAAMAKAAAQRVAAEAAYAEARANLAATASNQTYAQRAATAATAARQLASANSATAGASIALRGALGSVVGFLGGPWGVAFLAAGAVVALLSGKMAQAEADAATLQRGLDVVDQRALAAADASRTLAAGLDVATASTASATDASRKHAAALYDEQKAAVAAALAVANKNVVSAQIRTTDRSPAVFRNAESVDGGASFIRDQEQAKADLFRAETLRDKLLAENNRLQQLGSTTSRGVGGDRARRAREDDGVVAAAPAVARAHAEVADAAKKRVQISDEVREAERRVGAAKDIVVSAGLQEAALRKRAEMAGATAAALEQLQIEEAGLQVLDRLGVASLAELTGATRVHAEAAIAAAEARERQAIATEKAESVAATVRDLDKQIASERARTVAIQGGIRASIDYAKAEAVRQAVERAGTNLTAEQVAEIRKKVELLMQLEAANENANAAKQQAEELALLQLTNKEREIEIRAREIAKGLQADLNTLTDEEAKNRARIIAMQYVDVEAQARAIGDLKEGLRAAFIESGELGFDQIGDYALRKLREAIYDAFLAKPIEVIIKAVVGNVGELTNILQGAGGGIGGGIGGLLGGLGDLIGGAGTGYTIGKALGLGSGNTGLDAGLALGGSALGGLLASSSLVGGIAGTIGAGAGSLALGLGATAATSASLAGGLAATLASASVLGPIAAIAALAIGTLFKDDQRPYARSDIGVQGGKFAVTGGQALDQGPLDDTNKIAAQIAASLNAAADLFKLDVSKLSGTVGSFGYVEGKNTGNLGEGYFGGGGGGFAGAEFSGSKDPEKLAADIVRATILRAIDAGASDLSEAEKRVVREAADLAEAANKISIGRSLMKSVEDAILQLTNPAAFERKQALDAIEQSYQALKAQAQELIAAGLVTGDVLAKLDRLKELQVEDALESLANAAYATADKLRGSVADQILGIVDPAALRRRRVQEEIAEQRAQAQALAAGGENIGDLLAQLDILESLKLAELADEVSRTSDVFAQMRPRIEQWLNAMKLSPSAELSPAAQRAEALKQYQDTLAKARTGDGDALGNLTGAADRLLEIDRQATDNAQARLALFNQVTSEVGALPTTSAGGAGISSTAVNGTVAAAISSLEKLLRDPLSMGVTLGQAGASNDNAASRPVTLVNVPELRTMFADITGPQATRQVDAIGVLQRALEARLLALQAVSEEQLGGLREAMEAAIGAIDAGLAAVHDQAAQTNLMASDGLNEQRLAALALRRVFSGKAAA